MPEQDPSGLPEPPGPAGEPRNLPVPMPARSLVAAERREGWLAWTLRVIFGWQPGSIRANLTDVLKAGAGETGFSPKESAMLQNILGLREPWLSAKLLLHRLFVTLSVLRRRGPSWRAELLGTWT